MPNEASCESKCPIEGRITLYHSELEYDITNRAYVEYDVMQANDDHERHQVADIAEDGNRDILQRHMDLAFALCVELLLPYSEGEGIERNQENDILKPRETYEVSLRLPNKLSPTKLQLLTRLIHEFIVCRALAEWFAISYPSKAEMWYIKAKQAEEDIKGAKIGLLASRARRPLRPF